MSDTYLIKTISQERFDRLNEFDQSYYIDYETCLDRLKQDFSALFENLLKTWFYFIDVKQGNFDEYAEINRKHLKQTVTYDVDPIVTSECFCLDYISTYNYQLLFDALVKKIHNEFKASIRAITDNMFNVINYSKNNINLDQFDYFWCNDIIAMKLIQSNHIQRIKEGYRLKNSILIPLIEKENPEDDNNIILFKKDAIQFHIEKFEEDEPPYPGNDEAYLNMRILEGCFMLDVEVKGIRVSLRKHRRRGMIFAYLETHGKLSINHLGGISLSIDELKSLF